jgi:hypothetical protein
MSAQTTLQAQTQPQEAPKLLSASAVLENMEQYQLRMKVTSHAVVEYSKVGREMSTNSLKNLEEVKGGLAAQDLSDNAKKRFKKCCASLFDIATLSKLTGKRKKRVRFVFTTLTLPFGKISDYAAKRAFSRTLDKLKKYKFITEYVWRAEVQKRGALHFHMISTRYIPRERLRRIWSNALRATGEMDGFKEKYGMKDNQGVNIKEVYSTEGAVKYIQKYLSKDSQGKRAIQGRQWGASDGLRNFKPLDLPVYTDDGEKSKWHKTAHLLRRALQAMEQAHCYEMEYATLYFYQKNTHEAIQHVYNCTGCLRLEAYLFQPLPQL